MTRFVKAICPICGGRGRRNRDLRLLDAECIKCGWFYTSWPRVLRKRAAEAR